MVRMEALAAEAIRRSLEMKEQARMAMEEKVVPGNPEVRERKEPDNRKAVLGSLEIKEQVEPKKVVLALEEITETREKADLKMERTTKTGITRRGT